MRGEHARFFTSGGWGAPVPAFAFDLTKGAIYKQARSTGMVRYGRAPSSSDDDTRPLGMAYDIQWVIGPNGTEMTPLVNSTPLVPLGNAFSLQDAQGVAHTNADANNAVSYRGLSVERNGAWSLWCYLHTPPKGQVLKLHQWIWGAPGRGYLFQIRNGTAEIAGLSVNWTEVKMQALRALWALKHPTEAEETQTENLKKEIFVDFESLSFERSMGRGDWYGTEFMLSFIAEDLGRLHIVLEGFDATSHDNKAILQTRKQGVLWDATPLTLWNAGGAFFFTLGYPQFKSRAKLSFGPFTTAYYRNTEGEGIPTPNYSYNVSTTGGQTVEMVQTVGQAGSFQFGFDVDIINPKPRSTPWIYGLSSRLPPGARVPVQEVAANFDTDEPYIPANPASPRYTGPVILDVQPSCEGVFNRRTAKISMIDMLGLVSTGKPTPRNRVGTLTLGGENYITDGIVTDIRETDKANLKRGELPLFTSRPGSELEATLVDGWHICDRTECNPPPIGDGLTLGAHFKQLVAIAGFSGAKIASIPNVGKIISRPALGEDWCERVDPETMVGDAIRTLFSTYGLGWVPYIDGDGNWQMVQPSTVPAGEFSSSRLPTPHSEPGRLTILRDIDITSNSEDFWNHFEVIGGEHGEFRAEWTDWESLKQPLSNKFLGYRKTKRLVSTGLRSQDDCDFSVRSLRFMYGRLSGRRGQYKTYFHKRFFVGQRINCDGSLWEIEGLPSGSWAKDEMVFPVVEIETGL